MIKYRSKDISYKKRKSLQKTINIISSILPRKNDYTVNKLKLLCTVSYYRSQYICPSKSIYSELWNEIYIYSDYYLNPTDYKE